MLLVGTSLGLRRGAAALILYTIAGLAGIPWFAHGVGGYPAAPFGYVLGFIAAAAICGYLAERRADRRVKTAVPAMVVGEVVMYVIGVGWLARRPARRNREGDLARLHAVWIGDAIKCALAAALLPTRLEAGRRAEEAQVARAPEMRC